MNIAISSHHTESTVWTPASGLRDSFIQKGHNLTFYGIDDPKNVNLEKLIRESDNYDFIFICWCGPSILFDEQLKKLKSSTKTKIFLELGDEPQTQVDNQERIKYVDAFFTPDLRCHKQYISKGLPSHWMTHWCDDSVFYKKDNTDRKNICVTSCLGLSLIHI